MEIKAGKVAANFRSYFHSFRSAVVVGRRLFLFTSLFVAQLPKIPIGRLYMMIITTELRALALGGKPQISENENESRSIVNVPTRRSLYNAQCFMIFPSFPIWVRVWSVQECVKKANRVFAEENKCKWEKNRWSMVGDVSARTRYVI